MAKAEDTIKQEFRADADRISELKIAERGVAELNLGKLFNVSGGADQQNAREMGLKSETLTGMGGSGATAAARILEHNARETARRKASNDTAMFLQMLEQLSAEIRAIELQIERFDQQLEATDSLIGILESGGEIDPTDPEHQRLLRLAGIPEDEWGVVTLDDLRAHRIDLQTQRDQAKIELDKRFAQEAALIEAESNSQRGNPISASSLSMPDAVSQFAMRNPETDLENLSRRDLVEIGKINLVSEYLARSDHAERDIAWFKAAYAELNLSAGDGEVLESAVDMLVDSLSNNARDSLLKEDGLDQALVKYLVADKVLEVIEDTDIDDPSEQIMLQFIFADWSQQALSAAVNDPDTPDSLREMIAQNIDENGLSVPTIVSSDPN